MLNGAREMTGILRVSGWGVLDPVLAATVDATAEAVLSARWFAEDVTGLRGRGARALPHDVLALLEDHRRLER